MKAKALSNNRINLAKGTLLLMCVLILAAPYPGSTRETPGIPDPVVAIHVSEYTQALETMPATPPTPTGTGWSGYEWYYTSWHYSVAYDSLKETLSSAGIPFVVVTDANIAAGNLLRADGSPRYPILFSLNAEAIDDAEVAPLRNYVDAGGFLFVGASSFTRNLNGTTRTEFALATEMGLSTLYPDLMNWALSTQFNKIVDHRLVAGIPSGSLGWRMPSIAEQIPWGISPGHTGHWDHYIFTTEVTTATLIAQSSLRPLLTTRQYGQGNFIYYAPINPLIGYGAFDASTYSYLIFRNAIEWAFESAGLPTISVSPWRYQYDAAFTVRHDFENYQDRIRAIEASAAFESSHGAKGDYFFCTGTLRDEMTDKDAVILTIRNAVSTYGATIGSHNGGLKNPNNPSLTLPEYDYWHWGPDEALDVTPPPTGYADSRTYAKTSIDTSFTDIGGWLAGLDNGRLGCGAAANCPKTWAAPYFNSTREVSHAILNELGVITAGEQRISPFPSWTISTVIPGGRYPQLTIPPSEWFAGTNVLQALEDHTSETMRAAVDFYYNQGALINIYHHKSSTATGLTQEYVTYSVAKPRIWATNSVGIYDWWVLRTPVSITPSFSNSGGLNVAQVTIAGATDPDTAIDVAMPGWSSSTGSLQVLLNGVPAVAGDYRVTSKGIKVKVGSTVTTVEVRYSPLKLDSLSLNPATVVGGIASQGTVTLSAAAPAGGVVVALSSSNPTVAAVPANVTITEGNTSGNFTITTTPVTSSTPVTISAVFGEVTKTADLTVVEGVQVTVQTNPAGRSFTVDTTAYNSAQTFTWIKGSTHTIATTSPQSGGTGIQYVWNSWSDSQPISHSVAPTVNTTYTADFTTQYYLTMNASAGGTVSPASGWFNSAQSVQIQAIPNTGYALVTWAGSGTGSYSGADNPKTITMNGPIAETAAFGETIQATVQTNPAGRSFTVDATEYSSTQTFTWIKGSNHTIATTSPQSGGAGIQYVWSNWSDGQPISHTVGSTSNITYTANFTTQYQLTMNAGTGGSVTPPTGWFNSGQSVPIQATAASGYAFTTWTGTGSGSYSGSNNPASVTMSAPITQNAAFKAVVQVTVQTSNAGLSFSVDSTTYTSTQTFTWDSGSSHTIATTSPQSGAAGIQYVWSSWSDSGALSHSVAPAANTTYTANFTAQYYLTMSAGTGGSATPASGWFDSGQTVQIRATAGGGYAFTGWTGVGTGSYTGVGNPVDIVMNNPVSETAGFAPTVQITVQTNPAGRSFSVDDVTYSETQAFIWISGSSHTIATTSPQSGAAGTQYVWSSWSDSGSISHIVAPSTNTAYTANFAMQSLPHGQDFNSDGKADILWRHDTTGQLFMWLMNGVSTIGYQPIATVSDLGWQIQRTGDFNGDNKADILWRHGTTGQLIVWLMNGVDIIDNQSIGTVPDLGWQVQRVGDFNGDSKADILWRNDTTGQLFMWLMDGFSTIGYASPGIVSDLNWQIQRVGDFNGDGKADILWRHATTGQLFMWLMDGFSTIGYTSPGMVSDLGWQIQQVGDFNGDSKADILWRYDSSGQLFMWLMDGISIIDYQPIGTVSDLGWKVVK